MRIPIFLCLSLLGCDAAFIDLRPEDVRAAAQNPGGGPFSTQGTLKSRGTFEGRAGHAGSGRIELLTHPDGVELSMLDDFTVSGSPAPVVILTDRADIGGTLEAGDLEVAPLGKSTGAQRYFAMGATAKRYVFVWCKTFKVEMSRAMLQDVN